MIWPPLVFMLAAIPSAGQETGAAIPAPQTPAVVLDDVEVTARRGAARVAPEREYDGAAIDALAAWDISEVLARASERAGDREPPIIIINGERVADPSIFLGFPPDAMTRLELLPPEAAGLYGAPPGRRVMNLVMERRFSSTALQTSGQRPTAGGTSTVQADLRRSALNNRAATTFGGAATATSELSARERPDYTLGLPGAEAVSLRPEARALSANLGLSRPIGDWSSSLRLDARSASTRSVAFLDGAQTDNRRDNIGLTIAAGLNGEVLGWQTQTLFNAGLARSELIGLTDSRQQSRSIASNMSANRRLMALPGGDVLANLSVNLDRSWSHTERGGVDSSPSDEDRTARTTQLRGGVTVPLFRRLGADGERQAGPGDISLTVGGNRLSSDNGGGQGLDIDLNWSPFDRWRVNGSLATQSSAPSIEQLYAPRAYGDPVTVFDLVTGEAVQVVPILGGNPDLRAPSTDRLNLSLSAGPFTDKQLSLNLSYMRSETRNGVEKLSAPTPALEAAFPDRFIRDADGRLTAIDQRPLNLASSEMDMISTNLGATLPFPRGEEEPQTIQLNLNLGHRLSDLSRFGPGAPVLDRLAGVGGGGQPRQTAFLSAETRRGRWSLNATGQWQSAYSLRRGDQPGPDDLEVDALGRLDLRIAFSLIPRQAQTGAAAPGDAPGSPPVRRSTRGGGQITLQIENLLDARPGARLADGRNAPGYGRDDRDPLGRQIRLQLSKRF